MMYTRTIMSDLYLHWISLAVAVALIFTSRDLGILNAFSKCVIYEVDLLHFDEAKKLFCQHAFKQEEIPNNLIEINYHLETYVKKVVQKCDGLPLTLEVLGSYLRSHKTNASIWKETIDKLGEAQSVDGVRNDRVWASLRLSYDALCPEEQGISSEAGINFFEKPVERALAAWSTAYLYPETRWANLLTSMVKGVPKTKWDKFGTKIEYEEVWVHEHLRDLAASLSGGAMVDGFKAVDRFNANPVEAMTSILRLQFFPEYREYFDEYPAYQLGLLDKMDKLKYLELLHVLPEGSRSNFPRKLPY